MSNSQFSQPSDNSLLQTSEKVKKNFQRKQKFSNPIWRMPEYSFQREQNQTRKKRKNKGLSLLENTAVMGVPYPSFVKKTLDALKEKGDNA